MLTCRKRVNGYALKIEDLQEAMSQLYHTMYGNKVNKNSDTDIGLASNNGPRIICYQCNKKEYKADHFQDNNNDNNNHSDNINNSINRGSSRGRRKFNGSFSCCKK